MPELEPTPLELLSQLLGLKAEIDALAKALPMARGKVFDPVSLKEPKLVPSELGLHRTVSWLYVTIHEAGGVSVRFLLKRLAGWDLDPEGVAANHLDTIHHLRTYLQHNLLPTSKHDREILNFCREWFNRRCGVAEPDTEDQWQSALIGLVTEAVTFLRAIRECLRQISQDESVGQICAQWQFQVDRFHPPQDFEAIIMEVAFDVGQEGIDVAAFCKRYYQRWSSKLQNLTGEYDFHREARRLIENDLLHEWSNLPPITGEDIMVEFGLEPGPEVGRLGKLASRLYEEQPCDRQTLLKRLRENG